MLFFYIMLHMLHHVTLQYITDRHVRINGTLRYVAVSSVALHDGGKPALEW